MILKRSSSETEAKQFIGVLCDAFDAATWEVFQPQFIDLGSDSDYDAHLIKIGSGESAFRLTSTELRSLLKNSLIGFDWTDLRATEVGGRGQVVYLQCVDGLQWHARVFVDEADCILRMNGFAETNLGDLPFPVRKVP